MYELFFVKKEYLQNHIVLIGCHIEKAPVAPESAKTRSIDTPADKYNFNEMDPNENGNFDRLHWRNQTSIYLRVSSDDYADKSITDTKGRTGY